MSEGETAVFHIVAIEDNEADVYLLNHALRESGINHRMTRFHSGEDALLALCGTENRGPELPVPDLILIDLNIPRSDGFEVIARIRSDARLSAVPLAVITSSPSPGDRERCEALGAGAYIQKATQLHAFVAGVGAAVRRLLSEGPARRLSGAGG